MSANETQCETRAGFRYKDYPFGPALSQIFGPNRFIRAQKI